MSQFRKGSLAVGLVALVAIAGAAVLVDSSDSATQSGPLDTLSSAASAVAASLGLGPAGGDAGAMPPAAAAAGDAGSQGTFIVVFKEPALGTYEGDVVGMPAPQRRPDARGKLRLDVKGAQARNYVAYLRGRQADHESKLERTVGRALGVRSRMQHAINGIVTDLTPAEATRIEQLPEVMLVEAYREYPLNTDVGPELIGAGPVWSGSNFGATQGYQGEGIVFGILDSGINFGSPSFAAVDPIDGYTHVNPLGSGTFLGSCAPGGVDAGRCNDKLIGGYDFVCGAPGNQCGVAGNREEPGFGDTSGHGTHTASTAAGNRRDAEFRGGVHRISGVAPRGNIVAYDICYTNSAGQGLCPNVSAVAAIEQALVDGIVDVFNYSIGGGSQPWSEAVSLGFLNASNAGIYVAASAGNSGPGPNTLGHVEPWVASTAAAQHGRGAFAVLMQVTGPAPVPESLQAIVVNEGSGGVAHSAAIPASTPMRVSARIDTNDDACAALPAGTFAGAIAVVRRGSCPFAIKANNATAAGAIAVVIANNAAGALIPSVPGTTVPVFGALQADGDALRDFHATNPTSTAMIGFPAVGLPNTADALAAFSSRGPAGSFNLLKPDITAPGVLILAAYAGPTITGFEDLVNTISGTSMASPHQAGAAGLVRQARPGWSMPEIKSALMMTAKQPVFLQDEVSVADPFAAGAGRVQVDRAINAGLVMHESGENYLAANPATGGDPATLNQPSMGNRSCFQSCSFTRSFRNTLPYRQVWHLSVEGLPASVTPRQVSAQPGQLITVRVVVDSRQIAANGVWNFGTLVLTPPGARDVVPKPGQRLPLPTLRLPIGVAVQPPVIQLPALTQASVAAGGTSTGTTSVANTGGSTLSFTVDNTGTGQLPVYAAARGLINNGFSSSFYTNSTTPAQFASDDFVLGSETRITRLSTEGFTVSGLALATVTSHVMFSIYPDAGGVPAGNPQSKPGAAVWSFSAAPTAVGVSTTGNGMALDLVAAAQDLVLPAGRYWLVANARTTVANRWAWFASATGDGTFATITPGATGTGAWVRVQDARFGGLAMQVTGRVACGAAWMGAFSPSMGQLAPGVSQSISFAIQASALSAGTYTGHYCVSSNDPVSPKVAGRVSLQVN
ncbi:MAG: S8 family serine peptidase [Pseudomonadota bacterium]|nr:S8 family serine peptidase [Pseudomonadota bacterium]